MRIPSWLVRTLLGATAAVGTTAAVTTVAAPTEAHAGEGSSAESAVFARFSELDEQDTLDRLDELLKAEEELMASKADTSSGSLSSLTKLMASGASAKELEAAVLPFVAKRKIDDAETSLAAIMLDYYETYLAADLAKGNLQPADVFDDMIDTNDALTTAAFGAGGRHSRIRRVRR